MSEVRDEAAASFLNATVEELAAEWTPVRNVQGEIEAWYPSPELVVWHVLVDDIRRKSRLIGNT